MVTLCFASCSIWPLWDLGPCNYTQWQGWRLARSQKAGNAKSEKSAAERPGQVYSNATALIVKSMIARSYVICWDAVTKLQIFRNVRSDFVCFCGLIANQQNLGFAERLALPNSVSECENYSHFDQSRGPHLLCFLLECDSLGFFLSAHSFSSSPPLVFSCYL